MRYLAMHPLTGEWQNRDLPLRGVTLSWSLDSDRMDATLAPPREWSFARKLDEWGTAIFAADDAGSIRWGGLYTEGALDGQGAWQLTCRGYKAYLHGLPYLGRYTAPKGGVDPAHVVRLLWDHAQSYAGGRLGVVVHGSTPELVGVVEDEYDERYKLRQWDHRDMGREAADLSKQYGFRLVESHRWAGHAERAVDHRLHVAYPRAGRRRHDVRAVEGEQIVEPVAVRRDGMDYANVTVGFGAGEGSRRVGPVEVHSPGGDDGRLRRVSVVDKKAIEQRRDLHRACRADVAAASSLVEIQRVTWLDEAWALHPGDDILVEADVPWAGGHVAVWSRITRKDLHVDEGRAVLQLQRADEF